MNSLGLETIVYQVFVISDLFISSFHCSGQIRDRWDIYVYNQKYSYAYGKFITLAN